MTVAGGLGHGYRGSPFIMYGGAHIEGEILKLTRSILANGVRGGGDAHEVGFVIIKSEAFSSSRTVTGHADEQAINMSSKF